MQRRAPIPTVARIPAPPTLVDLSRVSAARLAAQGRHLAERRRRGIVMEHPPSPHREAYLRLPTTSLLADSQIRDEVRRTYTRTGSVERVLDVLTDHANRLTRRRAALTRREVELLREWRAWAVADALADVKEAGTSGLLFPSPSLAARTS